MIDQGIDATHPELKGRLLPGYNVKAPMNQPLPDFHGTHVAGIIAANKNNAIGGYGVNPNAMIMPIDVFNREGGVSDYLLAEALIYAVNKGAKIINMSLGSPAFSTILQDAVETALAKNVTIIAAAGNEGTNVPNYPAAFKGVISVGAVNHKNELTTFSSYGPTIDLVAPGEDIYAPIYDYERKSSFAMLSGTSMATPMVTGAASLLLSKYPQLTPAEVAYILNQTAKDLGPKGYDPKYGYGLINPVGALSFDLKKLPKADVPLKNAEEKLSQANYVDFKERYIEEGEFVKSNQVHFVKFKVKKGEYYQTTLSGSDSFDYGYTVHFFSDQENKSILVNRVKEGVTEGNLFKAPCDGTILIEINDVNGHYGMVTGNPSKYKLIVERLADLQEDENTIDNMINVDALPFKSEKLTFTGEDGDEDYFKLTNIKKPQLVRISVTAVPGENPTIKVYSAKQLKTKGIEEKEPLFLGNSMGMGKGEDLVFNAVADGEYIISISNQKNPEDDWIPNYNDNIEVGPSAIPYFVTINAIDLGSDEDGIVSTEEYDKYSKDSMNFDHEIIPTVKEKAIPFKLDAKITGSLQELKDVDWYHFRPEENGIFEFTIESHDQSVPQIDINSIKEAVEEEEGQRWVDYPLASNRKINKVIWEDDLYNKTIYVGLEKEKDYYIKINNANNRLLFGPYSIWTKEWIRFTSKFAFWFIYWQFCHAK